MPFGTALSNKYLCMYFKLSGSHIKIAKTNKTSKTKKNTLKQQQVTQNIIILTFETHTLQVLNRHMYF